MKRVATLLCAAIAVQAAGENVSVLFQQGNLRKDGIVTDAAYETKAVTLRGGTSADTVQTSTSMYIGDHSSGAPMRGLFSFDLSYIKTLTGGSLPTIHSVTFVLTTATANGSFSGQTAIRAHLTDAFADETAATYTNPGTGHAVGGNIGAQISTVTLSATIAGSAGQTLSFTDDNWTAAVSNALSSADSTLNFIVKRGTEDGGAQYFFRPADDEYSGALGIVARPQLVIDLTYEPKKLSLFLIQ